MLRPVCAMALRCYIFMVSVFTNIAPGCFCAPARAVRDPCTPSLLPRLQIRMPEGVGTTGNLGLDWKLFLGRKELGLSEGKLAVAFTSELDKVWPNVSAKARAKRIKTLLMPYMKGTRVMLENRRWLRSMVVGKAPSYMHDATAQAPVATGATHATPVPSAAPTVSPPHVLILEPASHLVEASRRLVFAASVERATSMRWYSPEIDACNPAFFSTPCDTPWLVARPGSLRVGEHLRG